MNEDHIKHVAIEESQQDWNKLENKNLYQRAFFDGGKYVFDEMNARIVELEDQNAKLAKMLKGADDYIARLEMDQ